VARSVAARSAAPSFLEVRQRVRRYRPSDFLPAVARVACAVSDREAGSFERWRGISPWGLALLARESVVRGTEHRSPKTVSDFDVLGLHDLLNASHDRGPADERDRTLGLLARAAYEQFPYQESDAEEVARTWALLHDAVAETGNERLTPSAVDELVGGPLQEVLRATWLLYGASRSFQGQWEEAWWSTDEAQPLTRLTPANRVVGLANDLTADLPAMRSDHANVPPPPPHLLRYDYNPLHKTPLVRLQSGLVIAPQPRLILRRMSPAGLYYTGRERIGTTFSDDLGKVVEQYVGMNLRCVPETKVQGEVVYDRDSKRSVDWFWELPGLLVLLEVKGMRATIAARIGAPNFAIGLADRLSVAVKQLNRTAGLIDTGHVAFRHLPRAGKRIGVIVTAEPLYQGNSTGMRQYLADASIPTLLISLRDLESLVAHDADEVAVALTQIATDPELSRWLFSSAISHVLSRTNPARGPLLVRALGRLGVS
jgi:hypothetical protein